MSLAQNSSARRRLVLGILAVALSGLALLLWARLKLVAGVPRTALAEPRAVTPPVDSIAASSAGVTDWPALPANRATSRPAR